MLTHKQEAIVDYIKESLRTSGVSPSLREIGRRFKITYGTVQSHLAALQNKGFLEEPDGRHRGLVPIGWKPGVPIPVVGQVQAGLPILAEQNIESYLSVDSDMVRGARLFALRVKGDSMENASILDGDTVIVRQQESADNGDIVVAYREGEATVKYFRRTRGRVLLEPANPRYSPFAADEFSIVGKVVGLVRAYRA
jgi:repressor LexA